ncbi:nitrile hydratase accessory protein [Vineibacter terrae]|uniref:nitrile hydratase accessory protein n=1 Tax=Vineibacter terrae TaxID=2586908 RepID=UPI002E307803|nr:nitrile hydratase accessory protein [Vineibacter terrae]HEX2886655.1 nitrile hydratase accessory protein [Vineibacter terrae]
MDATPASPLLAKALPVTVDADVTFAEPWEAKAFAIIVKLAQAGCFTWGEWVECFAQEVAAATAVEAAGGRPKTYYEQWLSAAETLLVDKGVTSREQLLAKRLAIGVAGPMHVMKT